MPTLQRAAVPPSESAPLVLTSTNLGRLYLPGRGLAARGRSTFSELRRYAPVAAAMATLTPTFWAERPQSV